MDELRKKDQSTTCQLERPDNKGSCGNPATHRHIHSGRHLCRDHALMHVLPGAVELLRPTTKYPLPDAENTAESA